MASRLGRGETPARTKAAMLSDRYITARFLPDKAIDLVDEASSRLRMEIDSRPVEIDEVERAVRRLEIEEMALAKESDPASRERLTALRAELAERRVDACFGEAEPRQPLVDAAGDRRTRRLRAPVGPAARRVAGVPSVGCVRAGAAPARAARPTP